MIVRPPQVGRFRAVALAGVALALATAAPGAFWRGGPPREAAARPLDAPRREALAFDGHRWGATLGEVGARLARRGWTRSREDDRAMGGAAWRGRWRGEEAACCPEFAARKGLVAVTLRFEPATTGEALALYARLGADLERRYGPELVDTGPARATERVHDGLRWRLVRVGEPAGARLWTGEDGAAAALQLDGERRVWVRWEAPNWEAEFAPDAPPNTPRR